MTLIQKLFRIPTQPPPARRLRPHGQSLVEFALLLPLIILILFGATDLGRAFQAYIAVTNASREGARQGAIDRLDQTAMIAAAQQEAGFFHKDKDGNDISDVVVTITCDNDPCAQYHPIQVEVCYDFDLILSAFFTQPITICRDTEMMAK